MDLFCLDQSTDATIPMADQLASIPTVYKSSRCVRVLIESPVCREWAEIAVARSRNKILEEDITIFGDYELQHARSCRYMMFADPWFDRLWTRQEGLYAKRIQVVSLNQKPCPRFDSSYTQGEKWKFTGISAMHRNSARTFLNDKLAYHGHDTTTAPMRFQAYIDLVYRGDLDMTSYQSLSTNVVAQYSPLDSAWRSGRATTKARDYVLAVFPDIMGYQVPLNARSLSFTSLLQDAFKQLPQLQLKGVLAVKISNGVAESRSLTNGIFQPHAVQNPTSVTAAYDTFALVRKGVLGYSEEHATHNGVPLGLDRPFKVIAHGINVRAVQFTRAYLPKLLDLWESTADFSMQLLSCPPSSPCFGSSRQLDDYEEMHYRGFASQFCKPSIEGWVAERPGLVAHGVVDLEKMSQKVTDAEFELYLTRFMACLVCGTTRTNGVTILETSEFRLISTLQGKSLLALINKEYLQAIETSKYVLCSRGMTKIEGLHIGAESGSDSRLEMFGRTWIPKDGLIEET